MNLSGDQIVSIEIGEFRSYISELRHNRLEMICQIDSMDQNSNRISYLLSMIERINQDITRTEKILDCLLSEEE